ncbi:MAG: hypothetical protein KJZ80_01355 [Hyphomicrobiaceae bacterium]|nr:hypothetical protein [Hyphomicrobiaceae bacterium]
MKRTVQLGAAFGLAAALLAGPAGAHGVKSRSGVYAAYPAASYYRAGKPKVYGYAVRRGGGYSYVPEDVINTYGNSRTLFGGINAYRDPMLDRQTRFGPFDHGFFFDSAIAPRGGDAPYQN